MSISHSIRMFVVDTGVGDIIDELPASDLGSLLVPYKVLVWDCIFWHRFSH